MIKYTNQTIDEWFKNNHRGINNNGIISKPFFVLSEPHEILNETLIKEVTVDIVKQINDFKDIEESDLPEGANVGDSILPPVPVIKVSDYVDILSCMKPDADNEHDSVYGYFVENAYKKCQADNTLCGLKMEDVTYKDLTFTVFMICYAEGSPADKTFSDEYLGIYALSEDLVNEKSSTKISTIHHLGAVITLPKGDMS